MARTLLALIVGTLGCRAPARALIVNPAPRAGDAGGNAVVTIAAPPIPRPSWMEEPIDRFPPAEWSEFFPPRQPRKPPRFGPFAVATTGQGAALVSTTHGYFIVDTKDGISGPHDVGWYDSAAFTKASLFVGHHGGGLERLRKLSNGGWSEPEEVKAPADAIGWVAGSSVIVGRAGAAVVVSRDEGSTFARAVPHVGEMVTDLSARGDDVIVAQTDAGATYTSVDRGKTFARTVDVEGIDRLGEWIFASDRTCKGDVVVAALARDGRTWVRVPDFPEPTASWRERNLGSLFASSPGLVMQPPQSMPWADDLAAPASTFPKFSGSPLCPGIARGTGRRTKNVYMADVGEDIEGAPDCSGVACIAQMRPGVMAETKTRAYLMHDALCEAKLDAEACASTAKLIRPPHAAFVSDSSTVPGAVRSVRSVPLPAGCVPHFVTYSAGLVVLVCAGKGQSLFVSTESGAWTPEPVATLSDELRFDDLDMLADGTTTLTTYRSAAPRQWLRRPVELGAADAWREVSKPGAVGYLPRFGGVVDVVVAEPTLGSDVFTLIEDSPDKPPRTVVSRVKVGGDLWCLGHKDGQLVGLRRRPSGGFEHFVVEDGAAVFDGVVLDGSGRAHPMGTCGA